MMKNKLILLITLLMMVFTSGLVYGLYEDFEISSSKEVNILSCVTSRDGIITVTNTGTIASGYQITVGGSGSSFIALGPKSFVLEPGKSQEILTYFAAPCDSQGEYDIEVYVNTVLDLEKKIQQKLIVEKPLNIEINPINYVNQIKPCNLAAYKYMIKNNGVFQETYTIEFEKPLGKYVSVNFNQITLGAGQQIEFDFYLSPSCELYGNYTIPFTIKTSNTKLSAKTFAYLIIDREYDYILSLGEAHPYTNNTIAFLEHSQEELYSLCSNSKDLIPIKITNNVEIPNIYNIYLKSPLWAKLVGNRLELNNNQEGISSIFTDTFNVVGDFSASVNVISQYGEIERNQNVILSVENCYEPEILLLNEKKSVVVDYNPIKIPLNIKNTGIRTVDYIINLEGEPSWLSLESNSINIAPGQVGVINIISTPHEMSKRGTYNANINVNVKDSGFEYKDSIKIKLVTMNLLDKFYYNFLKPYLIYLLLALALLVLLFLVLFLVIRKQMKKPKKIKKEKDKSKNVFIEKKSEKLSKLLKNKKFWFLLILLLLLTILGLSLFLYKYYTSIGDNDQEIIEEQDSESIFTKAKEIFVGFFSDYWIYFIVGLGILLLLIIMFFVLRKLKKKGIFKKKEKKIIQKIVAIKQRKKIDWKKVKNKLRPSKRTLKILWIILAFLLLIGLGFLIYYFWPGETIAKVWENRTIFIEKNITEIASEDSLTKTTFSERIKSFFTAPFFVSIKYFFIDYINYILYTIIGWIILVLLILLILILLRRFKKNRVTEFEAGSIEKEVILRNEKISFGEIILKLKKPAYSVGLLMRKVKSPTFIIPDGKIYEYDEIKKENIDDSNIEKILIRFKVKKSWLKRYNIKIGDVSLKRYHNQWLGVNTKNISEDKKYYYYESLINQVGVFAIVGKPTEIIKEQKVIITKKPEKIKKQKKKFDKKKLKKLFWLIFLLLLLIIIGGLFFIFWALIVAFILLYIWFILGAVGLLMVFGFLFWVITWLKRKKFKLKYKTKKRLLGLLSILLLVIAIILLFLYLRPVFVGLANQNRTITIIEEVEVCKVIDELPEDELTEKDIESCERLIETKYISKRLGDNILFRDEIVKVEILEDSQVEEKEVITQKPTIIPDEPSIIISSTDGIPNQEWNEGTNLTIKIDKYFKDPDGDELYYTNTELKNIKVYYIDGEAFLIPNKNWHGTEFVIFTAKDMKGGEVNSNLVKLTVLEVPKDNFLIRLWEWLN
jgi:PGF-pre-PGF domain-containing protein